MLSFHLHFWLCGRMSILDVAIPGVHTFFCNNVEISMNEIFAQQVMFWNWGMVPQIKQNRLQVIANI
jgi:hypothetical protein